MLEMIRLRTTSGKLFHILLFTEEHHQMTAWSASENPCEWQLSAVTSKTVKSCPEFMWLAIDRTG